MVLPRCGEKMLRLCCQIPLGKGSAAMNFRKTFSTLLATGLIIGFTGCSSGNNNPAPSSSASQAAPATSSSSTNGSGTASGSPASSTPAVSTTSASPGYPAATGLLLTIRKTCTFHLITGLEWVSSGDKTSTIATETFDQPKGAEGFVQLNASMFPQITDDFDRMAQTALKDQAKRLNVTLKRAENRTINGVTGYVLQGGGDRGQLYEWGGLDSNNVLTVFTFVIPKGLKVADWVEPVLASIRWL